ncbi:MAG: response regulator transcription factor [Chitinophagaceae bacterium]
MITNPNILLVEDDRNLGYILTEYLAMKGFTVTWSKDGKEALSLLEKNPFSLCILDVMLPSMDGFSLAEKISEAKVVMPYIFLTAKNLKIDKLKAFKLGCDDYIVKPVDEEELVARIQAVLKRTAKTPEPLQNQPLQFGNSFLYADKQVLQIDTSEYKLTSKETEVLLLLLKYKNTLLDRETALKKIWGSNEYFNRRSMDVIISRLRKHLSVDTNLKITNIHGKGYMLMETPAQAF